MRKMLLALTLGLAALPVASVAQMYPENGPPPEMRAQMDQARNTAKTEAMNALSADHRAKVQAIVSQVQSGTLSRQDGSSQIDALLSPQESQAVLAAGQKMRNTMRSAFEANHPNEPAPNGSAPPNANGSNSTYTGPSGGEQNGGRPGGGMRQPDAGRLLLMLNGPPPGGPPHP
jgi:hypothetical protein